MREVRDVVERGRAEPLTSLVGGRAGPERGLRGLVVCVDVRVLAGVLEVVVVLDTVGRAGLGSVVRAAAAVGGVLSEERGQY